MFEKIQSQQVFLNTATGLQRVFELLNTNNAAGISLNDINNIQNFTNLTSSDVPFIQFLNSEFKTFDADNDGIISSEELNKVLSSFQEKGFTYEQLFNIINQTNMYMSKSQQEMLENVLENFKKIDTNFDGKVSQSEIDNYNMNKEIDEMKSELNKFKAEDMSTFYVDKTPEKDSESSDDISYDVE